MELCLRPWCKHPVAKKSVKALWLPQLHWHLCSWSCFHFPLASCGYFHRHFIFWSTKQDQQGRPAVELCLSVCLPFTHTHTHTHHTHTHTHTHTHNTHTHNTCACTESSLGRSPQHQALFSTFQAPVFKVLIGLEVTLKSTSIYIHL